MGVAVRIAQKGLGGGGLGQLDLRRGLGKRKGGDVFEGVLIPQCIL